MKQVRHIFFLWTFLIFPLLLWSQGTGVVRGTVKNDKGEGLPLVNIAVKGSTEGTVSKDGGNYVLITGTGKKTIGFSFVGYGTVWKKVSVTKGDTVLLNVTLHPVSSELEEIKVEDKYVRNTNLVRIDPKIADHIVNPSDRVIALVKTQPGVISGNELSSQYSVRGGNFDENLIYVNDIEIYRPMLIHSGQQEGLSFINSDMVSSLIFSAGGFEAKYGGKMSSVLDIKYRTPVEFHASLAASLLGSSVYIEDAAKNGRFSYLMGFRHKTNQYLLTSLDTKGEYKPQFIDWQAMFNYNLTEKLTFSFLGDYSGNNFRFVPVTRETDFGTAMDVKRLTIYFEGQESDQYQIYFGSGSLIYRPDVNTEIKLIATAFNSIESENYDILGEYWIGKVSTDFGSEDYDKVVKTEGVGAYLNHARNRLNIFVKRLRLIGRRQTGNSFIQWGARFQRESVADRMNEWRMIDSAGYSLPHPPDSVGYTVPEIQPGYPLVLKERIYSDHNIHSNRFSAFIQNTWGVEERIHGFSATLGARISYGTLNKETLFSPRISFSYKPAWEKDIVFRLSGGVYYQPPFYREMKDIYGDLHTDTKAQSSLQVVLGSDYNFKIWDRNFKWVTEIYYKYFNRLTPYIVDNVRIRYYADQHSKGYAGGIDMKINGEFVEGAESWASISIMKTAEDIAGDYKIIDGERVETGYIPRPTDRLVSMSLFFQDYLPGLPTYRVSLMGTYATGTPFGAPNVEKQYHVFRTKPYFRVDAGFSKEIIGPNGRKFSKGILKHINTFMITAEVLNLFNFYNTSGYTWVSDVYGRQWPVPNYLTPRLFNLRLMVKI